MTALMVYTADHGLLVLGPGDVAQAEEWATNIQDHLWDQYSDALIGVPEVEVFNAVRTAEFDRRINATRRKHGRFR